MKSLVACFLSLISMTAFAVTAIHDLRVTNPERNIGYIVGDVFKRTVNLDVGDPYRLSRASLPVEGTTYQGIELQEVRVTEKKSPDMTHYRIVMTYQVFTRSNTVTKVKLPTETLKLTGEGKTVSAPIPAWRFRISPIAVYGESDIEKDMSPYRAPLEVETGFLKPIVGFFLVMVFVSVLGLIYINVDGAWFPGMGGPFSASYRKVSGLGASHEDITAAVVSIQRAFNLTYGENLFVGNLDDFLRKHPNFSKLKSEIEEFFNLTQDVLFGVKTENHLKPLSALAEFCKSCRDCERGVA